MAKTDMAQGPAATLCKVPEAIEKILGGPFVDAFRELTRTYDGWTRACDELTVACGKFSMQNEASGISNGAPEDIMRICQALNSAWLEHSSSIREVVSAAQEHCITKLEKSTEEAVRLVKEVQRKFELKVEPADQTLNQMLKTMTVPPFFLQDEQAKRETKDRNEGLKALSSMQAPGPELPRNFACVCRYLHLRMHAGMRVRRKCGYDWKGFCAELDKEGMSVVDKEGMSKDRWSQPVHSQLAEALSKNGFTMTDWEISLPSKDGKVSFSPQVGISNVAYASQIQCGLTDAQMSLEYRIRDFCRRTG